MLRAALALGLAAASVVLLSAQDAGKTAAAVDVASRYVANYQKEFSAIVCEELQTQTLIKPNGWARERRTLVSDLMFVKVDDTWVPLVFRDVISVDGKPVRDRGDRLRKLFVDNPKTAIDQARAIAKESGRYNLGRDRMGNSPLLPMFVFDPHLVSRFAFALKNQTVTFKEQKRPSLVGYTIEGLLVDLPARGSAVVDLAKGTILSATLTAESPEAPVSTTFSVKYQHEPAVKMFVPKEMAESYKPANPREDSLEAKMTYSAFRRFQVTTSEIIK